MLWPQTVANTFSIWSNTDQNVILVTIKDPMLSHIKHQLDNGDLNVAYKPRASIH